MGKNAEDFGNNGIVLREMIAALVPLKIAEMAQGPHEGPSERDWERVKETGRKWVSGEKYEDGGYRIMWDVFVAGFGTTDVTRRERQDLREMTADFIHALAVMAWCPGGVKLFGLHIVAPVVWEPGYGKKAADRRKGWAKTFPFGWCVEDAVPFEEYYHRRQPLKPMAGSK